MINWTYGAHVETDFLKWLLHSLGEKWNITDEETINVNTKKKKSIIHNQLF